MLVNKKPRIICITGKARHGKTTTAEYLKQKLEKKGEMTALICNYGDLVKYSCKHFWGWNGEKDAFGRTLLQTVGTDIVRAKCPDYWINYIIDMVNFTGNLYDYVLIGDCRFPNEIEMWKEAGYEVIVIKVEREDFKSDLSEKQLKHPSETALDNYHFDYIASAKSGVQNLYSQLDVFLKTYLRFANTIDVLR